MGVMMEDQSGQVSGSSERNQVATIRLVAAGALVLLCGLTALAAVYYLIARPYFGPKSQAVLAPDHTLVSSVDPAGLEEDAQILNARSRALGARTTFRVEGNNQIVAVGPASEVTPEMLDQAMAIGLLELVGVGAEPVMEGTQVATDFDYPYFAPVEGTRWHTVLTNAEFASVSVVPISEAQQYEITFTLTPGGRETLAEFTASHIGQYLCVVLDKRVLSCPIVRNAITGGQGVIQGAFTREQAESLAVNLRVRGPLPIPLEVVSFVEGGK